ncbi:MAG: carbon-nitrogen hydrolase family protein [Desulfobacula sp.]|jgi:predicted amidohydrolase|nr:carbon-nitrogen hydrolase family protein [Desulfobacula sp.]MBT7261275.1 carbon-nitrogen hydrolase family protein [Desulfobacula sp.]
MRVTVCELPNNWTEFDTYWKQMIHHLEMEKSDLLILPEMPFFEWITKSNLVDPSLWKKAVKSHDKWMDRLSELPVAMTIASRPVIENGKHLNKGFIFTLEKGVILVHDKYYLPDEPGYYEASWYERGEDSFKIILINGIKIGFLICTEIWFTQRARQYLRQDIDILVCPRATPKTKVDIWVTGGKAAAIVSGAYCLSSNYNGPNTSEEDFGGTGWIIEPERGDVLGFTSLDQNFLTLDIDINDAKKAKKTYPRYVKE